MMAVVTGRDHCLEAPRGGRGVAPVSFPAEMPGLCGVTGGGGAWRVRVIPAGPGGACSCRIPRSCGTSRPEGRMWRRWSGRCWPSSAARRAVRPRCGPVVRICGDLGLRGHCLRHGVRSLPAFSQVRRLAARSRGGGGLGQDRTVDLPLFRSTAPSAMQTCENGRHRQAKPR